MNIKVFEEILCLKELLVKSVDTNTTFVGIGYSLFSGRTKGMELSYLSNVTVDFASVGRRHLGRER